MGKKSKALKAERQASKTKSIKPKKVTGPSAAQLDAISREFAEILAGAPVLPPETTDAAPAQEALTLEDAIAAGETVALEQPVIEPGPPTKPKPKKERPKKEKKAVPAAKPQMPPPLWRSEVPRQTQAWNQNRERMRDFVGQILDHRKQAGASSNVYIVDTGEDDLYQFQSSKLLPVGQRVAFSAEPYETVATKIADVERRLTLLRSSRGHKIVESGSTPTQP